MPAAAAEGLQLQLAYFPKSASLDDRPRSSIFQSLTPIRCIVFHGLVEVEPPIVQRRRRTAKDERFREEDAPKPELVLIDSTPTLPFLVLLVRIEAEECHNMIVLLLLLAEGQLYRSKAVDYCNCNTPMGQWVQCSCTRTLQDFHTLFAKVICRNDMTF